MLGGTTRSPASTRSTQDAAVSDVRRLERREVALHADLHRTAQEVFVGRGRMQHGAGPGHLLMQPGTDTDGVIETVGIDDKQRRRRTHAVGRLDDDARSPDGGQRVLDRSGHHRRLAVQDHVDGIERPVPERSLRGEKPAVATRGGALAGRALNMRAHRVGRDAEQIGHLRETPAAVDEREHLGLAGGQRVRTAGKGGLGRVVAEHRLDGPAHVDLGGLDVDPRGRTDLLCGAACQGGRSVDEQHGRRVVGVVAGRGSNVASTTTTSALATSPGSRETTISSHSTVESAEANSAHGVSITKRGPGQGQSGASDPPFVIGPSRPVGVGLAAC